MGLEGGGVKEYAATLTAICVKQVIVTAVSDAAARTKAEMGMGEDVTAWTPVVDSITVTDLREVEK